MINAPITLEDITDGLDPEVSLDYKDELIDLVRQYNNAESVEKQDIIYDSIQDLLGKICEENNISRDLYGHTTTRYAHGNQRSGKYRGSGMDVGPKKDSDE